LTGVQEIVLSFPIGKLYTNADTQKELILKDNKGKAGIYC